LCSFFFKDLSISVVNASSQNDFQACLLDGLLFKQLLECLTIHDQARLHAVSYPPGTSSGWLKAQPQPSLGVSIFPSRFCYCSQLVAWDPIVASMYLPFHN